MNERDHFKKLIIRIGQTKQQHILIGHSTSPQTILLDGWILVDFNYKNTKQQNYPFFMELSIFEN